MSWNGVVFYEGIFRHGKKFVGLHAGFFYILK